NAIGFVVTCVLFTQDAAAQAWSYPAFQTPRIVNREFNVGVADGGVAGVSAVFQWREQTGSRVQLSLDAGFADPDRTYSTTVFAGGQLAYQLAFANAETPLDFLLTAGLNAAINKQSLFRVPFGVVAGHRFPLEGDLAITPFVHPRVSFDLCGKCAKESEIGLTFDLGASLEVTRSLALRASAFFGGSDLFDDDGFGISLAWTPHQLAAGRRSPRGAR
ncbi:MAG: hypothetical protein ACT4R6_06200, partial [Gemmatimonadaceae bacterium]